MPTSCRLLVHLAVLLCLLPLRPALAAGGAQLCTAAAEAAALRWSVPRALLLAITTAETGLAAPGGPPEPWPWTLNISGEGHWLASEDLAAAAATQAIAEPGGAVDIGCFQLNYRWHGAAFASPQAMLQPEANADYAARLLLQLYHETGSWRAAAGAYHSRTDARAETYVARLIHVHGSLQATPAAATGVGAPARPRGLTGARGALIGPRSAPGRLIAAASGGGAD